MSSRRVGRKSGSDHEARTVTDIVDPSPIQRRIITEIEAIEYENELIFQQLDEEFRTLTSILEQGDDSDVSLAIATFLVNIYSPQANVRIFAQKPTQIGWRKDSPEEIKKRSDQSISSNQVPEYARVGIPNIGVGGVTIHDLFQSNLDPRQINRYLINGGRASIDKNGEMVNTPTIKFGSLFKAICVDFSTIPEELIPETARQWAANSKEFYKYLNELIDVRNPLNPDLLRYFDESTIYYLFTHLAVQRLRRGEDIDNFYPFISKLLDKDYGKYLVAKAAVENMYQIIHKKRFDVVGNYARSRDIFYNTDEIDEELLGRAHEDMISLFEGSSPEGTQLHAEIKEMIPDSKPLVLDTSGILFAKRMGLERVEFSKSPDGLISTLMVFENSYTQHFPIEFREEAEDVDVVDSNMDVNENVRTHIELEILLMSLMVDYNEARKSGVAPHRGKVDCEQMLIDLARIQGIDLTWFKIIEDHDEIDPETGEVTRKHAPYYFDPESGESFTYLRHWSWPRTIFTEHGSFRRPRLVVEELKSRIPGLGDAIYWGQEASVDYYHGPEVDGIGELDHRYEPDLRDIDSTKGYKPPEDYSEFIITFPPPTTVNDTTGYPAYSELALRSRLLALETVLLNQV